VNALVRDVKTLLEFTKYLLEQTNCIGRFNEQNTNKLKYLHWAGQAGLQIPSSAVFASRSALARYQKEQKRLITKSIQDSAIIFHKGYYYLNYTERVMAAAIRKLPETFFPSFFQREFKKFADIRVFYLDGECYSMAIFSQQNKISAIDFRKYPSLPNRCVPFRLPPTCSAQVSAFMKQTGHRTGSLDFILTADGNLVFLELNPVGQFGFVSYCCNYNLEQKIAEHLLKKVLPFTTPMS
jgi:ATP-GRASP peptide maturase of grasp-with-spasm system